MINSETIVLIFVIFGMLLISVAFHEAAHAWMANRLGDPTAKLLGRISLNPLDHIDPIGTVLLPLFALFSSITTGGFFVFGWGKPTPFNPWNLQNPKRDSALISLAGPVSNFLLAAIFAIPFRLGLLELANNQSFQSFSLLNPLGKTSFILFFMIYLNLLLGLFNLIPIHPLDGFKVIGGLLSKSFYYRWLELERIGPILLLALIFFGGGIISLVISPLLKLFLTILLG